MYKTIKKLFSLFLTLCVCLTMTACSMSPQNMPGSPGAAESNSQSDSDDSSADNPSSGNSGSSKSSPSNPSKSSSSYKSSSSFSNAYGTSKTKCAHAGCNNYIASSGDTNCCTIHSRKCLNCKKYIDEDALYCIKCLSVAVDSATSSKDSSNSSGKSNSYSSSKNSGSYSSSSSKGCQFVYSNGSKCGASCSSGKTLCNKHMKELTDIYNSLTD